MNFKLHVNNMKTDFRNVKQLSRMQSHESWLTKDRFWNFVFWFGMSGGFSMATFVKFLLGFPDVAPYILLINLIIFPVIINFFNGTKHVEENILNSENIKLSEKQLPTGNFILLALISIPITGFLADKYATVGSVISSFIFFSGLLSGFCLYFIYKNCPISILFNRKMWKIEPVSSTHTKKHDHFTRNNRSDSSRFNVTSNPAYSSLSSNIHNKYR